MCRQQQGIDAPPFLGIDTHALPESAVASALAVLAADRVDVTINAESFKGRDHLGRIQEEPRAIIQKAFRAGAAG